MASRSAWSRIRTRGRWSRAFGSRVRSMARRWAQASLSPVPRRRTRLGRQRMRPPVGVVLEVRGVSYLRHIRAVGPCRVDIQLPGRVEEEVEHDARPARGPTWADRVGETSAGI